MKPKYLLASLLSCLALAVGCQKDKPAETLSSIKLSESYVALPTTGGSVEITVTAESDWELASCSRWITPSVKSGAAGETKVSFSVLETFKARSGEAKIVSGSDTQYIKFQQYFAEASGDHVYHRVDKVTAGKAYLIVYYNADKGWIAQTPNIDASKTYSYQAVRSLSGAMSDDDKTITLKDQDNSFVFIGDKDGFKVKQLADGRYVYRDGSYATFSVTDDDKTATAWTVNFTADGHAEIAKGGSYFEYAPDYGTCQLGTSENRPYLYEDEQEPRADELNWAAVAVSKVTAKTAVVSTSYIYSGIEPLDGAGFILRQGKNSQKIAVEVPEDGKFSYEFKEGTEGVIELAPETAYTISAYLDYEGSVHESEEVEFTTLGTETKTITVAELVKYLNATKAEKSLSLAGNYAEGIVTAVNGDGQNLYKSIIVEDGTGEAGSGVLCYGNAFQSGYAVGDKVQLSLLDATCGVNNGMYQITGGTVKKVAEGQSFTTPEITADKLSEYSGMYVKVKDVTPDGLAVASVWNDGSSSNATIAFKAVEGKAKFTVSTYKTCPWAKVIIGSKAKGDIAGVVKTNNGAPVLYPNTAKDVIAFANTGDPVIEKVTPSALSWKGAETAEKTITVTGTNISTVGVSCDNPHFAISVNGLTVKVSPVAANEGVDAIVATLKIMVDGGNSVDVILTHNPALLPGQKMITVVDDGFPSSYPSAESEIRFGEIPFLYNKIANYGNGIQFQKTASYLGNKEALGKKIVSIVVVGHSSKAWYPDNLTLCAGTSAKPDANVITPVSDKDAKTLTYDLSASSYTFFNLKNASDFAVYLESVTVVYED